MQTETVPARTAQTCEGWKLAPRHLFVPLCNPLVSGLFLDSPGGKSVNLLFYKKHLRSTKTHDPS